MRIIRAEHLGWCFGVRDAVALVLREARRGPVTMVGELVHNPAVNAALQAQGVQVAREIAAIHTATATLGSGPNGSGPSLRQEQSRASAVSPPPRPFTFQDELDSS